MLLDLHLLGLVDVLIGRPNLPELLGFPLVTPVELDYLLNQFPRRALPPFTLLFFVGKHDDLVLKLCV